MLAGVADRAGPQHRGGGWQACREAEAVKQAVWPVTQATAAAIALFAAAVAAAWARRGFLGAVKRMKKGGKGSVAVNSACAREEVTAVHAWCAACDWVAPSVSQHVVWTAKVHARDTGHTTHWLLTVSGSTQGRAA
jgi:hypothetical protein